MLNRAILSLLGVGLVPIAPGTAGSLAASLIALGLHAAAGFQLLLLATVVATAAGFWALSTDPGSANSDPPSVVIDEVAGQWLALLPVSMLADEIGSAGVFPIAIGWVLGFLLFRLFDIWKPWLIGWADNLGGPVGVMLDDILAGAAAAVVIGVLGGAALTLGWVG